MSSLQSAASNDADASIANGVKLFAITITADLGSVAVGADTRWLKFDHQNQNTEIRVPCTRDHGRRWTYLREHHEVVTSHTGLQRFLRAGGHALVERSLIEAWWPDFLTKIRCRRHYPEMPFVSVEHPPPMGGARRPRGELRQLVFARDEDRCRVCGRSADDALDLTLEIHHVFPHAKGGMTIDHNLIVLCHTCHDGMTSFDEHRQSDLHEKIAIASHAQHRRRHDSSVRRYREFVKRRLPEVDQLPPAVLQPVWDPIDRSFEQRTIHIMINGNLAVRWFPVKEWARIALRAWK